jgi:hypothetical protein
MSKPPSMPPSEANATPAPSSKQTLILPVLLVALGAGWLLTTLGILPGIDWAWTLGLAAVGILAFALSGLDKVSIVLGPFFIAASVLSLLRQRGHLPLDVELPLLVMLAGILLLVARHGAVPLPRWLNENP